MIIKVIKGSDLKAAIRYNTQKVSDEQATVLSAKNLPVDDLKNINLIEKMMRFIATPAKEFGTKVKDYVFHGVISPEEKGLSDSTLKNLADDYMREMGYANQPYFVVKHNDTDHTHIHIVSVDINKKGKRCVADSFAYRKTSDVRKTLEQKYNLSSPDKSKKEKEKQRVENAMNFLRETSFLSNEVAPREYKKNIQRVLRKVKNEYSVTDFHELNRVLKPYGIQSELSQSFDGVSFYSIDSDGKQTGKAIAGSRFLLSYKSWQEQFSRNMKWSENKANQIKISKNRVRFATDNLFKKYAGRITYGDYIAEVRKLGIDAQLNINDDGLLIGITYVDHGKGYTYKASEVDRNLSKDLKERLIEGGAGESPEIRQVKRLQEPLEQLFKRRVREQFVFESNAIKYLSYEKELYISYCKERYNSNEYNASFAWDQFVENKRATLDAVYAKEEKQFQEDADTFLKIARFVEKDKFADLLLASDFNFENGKLCHRQRQDSFVIDDCGVDFPEISNYDRTGKERKLTEFEKNFYVQVADGGIDSITFKWYNLNDTAFRFLSDEDKLKAQAKMMQDRIVNLIKTSSPAVVIAEAMKDGMLFDVRGDKVMIISPNTHITHTLTDENMRNYILSNKDDVMSMKSELLTKSCKSTLLYQAVQRFHRVLSDKYMQQERLIQACDWLAQYNTDLATDVRRMVEDGKAEYINQHLFEYMDKDLRFVNYDNYMMMRKLDFGYVVKADTKKEQTPDLSEKTPDSDVKSSQKQVKKKGMGI